MLHNLKTAFSFAAICALALSLTLSCGNEPTRAAAATDQDLVAGNASLTYTQALVLYAAGDVRSSAAGSTAGWQPVSAGDLIVSEQALKTGAGSTCEIQFGERAVVRIDENSEVRLEEVLLKPRETRISLRAAAGSVLCKVEKLSGDESFRVKTKTAVCGVRGTEFGVTVAADDATLLAVKTGRVSFVPAAFDLDTLKETAASGDPALTDALRALTDSDPEVTADEEADITAPEAARAADQVRGLADEVKKFAQEKRMTPQVREAMKNRFQRLSDDRQHDFRPPRRMSEDRRQLLERLNDLKRRRIQVVPRAEREKRPTPDEPREQRPPVIIRERERSDTETGGWSESLARIQVTVEPREAAIFLNGRPAGRGRFQGLFPMGESLSFQFIHPGYVAQTLLVDVFPEGKKAFQVTLARQEPERNSKAGPTRQPPGPPESLLDPGESGNSGETASITPTGPDRVLISQERPITRPFVGNLVVAGKRIIGVDGMGTVYGLDSRGKTVWKKTTSNNPNPGFGLYPAGGKIYYIGPKEIMQFDANDGTEAERFPADKVPGDVFERRLLADKDWVARPFEGGVNIADLSGREKSRTLDLGPEMSLSLMMTKDFFLIADQSGTVRVFDVNTGRPLPRPIPTLAASPIARGVWLPAACLYLAGPSHLACVDPVTRRVKWQKPVPGGSVRPGTLTTSEVGVYLLAGETLYSFSHQGEPLFPPLSGVSSPPQVCRDGLALGRSDGAFEIIDAGSGRTLKRFPHKFKIIVRPEQLGNYLVAATDAGEILIFNPAAMKPGPPPRAKPR
jgi:hypothetical protein